MWSKPRKRSAIADPLDPERRLALSYVPATRRKAVETLWLLDANLGSILKSSIQPIAAQLKLAWWRDALRTLDNDPPPPQPMLQDVAAALLPGGIRGADLSRLADGWEHLLIENLGRPELEAYAEERGGTLFRITAQLLSGHATPEIEAAGRAWALVDLARHTSDPAERQGAIEAAGERLREGSQSWPPVLRPLGMLAMLSRRDILNAGPGFEPAGAPKRMLRMLAHRLTGR